MAKTEEEKRHRRQHDSAMRDLELALERVRLDQEEAKLRKEVADAELCEWHVESENRKQADYASSDYANYRYWFYGDVDELTVDIAMTTLSKWDRGSEDTQPFEFVITSYGGDVDSGFALFDHMRALSAKGHKITTVVRGVAASMGFVLAQAGDVRVAGPNSSLLIHQASTFAMGKSSDLEDAQRRISIMEHRLASVLAHRSHLTVEQVKQKWDRRDWWFDADEALELGLIDEVR